MTEIRQTEWKKERKGHKMIEKFNMTIKDFTAIFWDSALLTGWFVINDNYKLGIGN